MERNAYATATDPNTMSVVDRKKAPTPKFLKTLRITGFVLATVGGTLLAAPVAIPAAVVRVAGNVVLARVVMTAVSQTVVEMHLKNVQK